VTAAGDRSVAAGANSGIIQTGDGANAWIVGGAHGAPPREPASVPPPPGLVGLPRPPVRHFVGRAGEMARLDRGRVAVVYGLGGVGKSELALQYASLRRDRYGPVWWFGAGGLDAGLTGLAASLQPGARFATEHDAAAWAKAWLQTHEDWLVVLDDVEDRTALEPVLGWLHRGRVIITSGRDVGWDDLADLSLRLDVLAPAASVALLTALSGQGGSAAAPDLVRELGHLPLAVRQAGAYLRQTRTSVDRYLERLRAEPAALLARDAALVRTFSLTVATVGARSPLAVRILQVMACLAPDGLPRDVLHPLAGRDEVDEALGLLASYSLVVLTPETVSVHRLLQTITAPQRRLAVDLVGEAAPAGNPQTTVGDWARWSELGPHVAALAARTPKGVPDRRLAALLSKAAVFESTQGRYQQALDHQRRALAVAGTEDTATYLNNLAYSLWALGRAVEAEPLQRQALARTEATFGPDHRVTATRLNNLATTLQTLGRPAEAEALQRRALAIAERAVGPDHPHTAAYLDNLANSLLALDRGAEAEPLYRRALAVTKATLGAGHPDTATCLINLGGCVQYLGRPAEAYPLLQRALSIAESALGADHPTTANCLHNVAHVLVDLGRAAEARPLYRRALAIIEATFGPTHPSAVTCRRNLRAARASGG
jgi:tetratricopeptide (TPR) repeat protein